MGWLLALKSWTGTHPWLQSRLSLDKKISETSIKNEVECRDDTVPKTVGIQEGTARRSESMQQSSATQSLLLCFWGLRKIVACSHSSSQCLLVPTDFGTVSSLHPTSFLMIFILVPQSISFSKKYVG